MLNEVPHYPTPFCYPLKFHIATVPHGNVIYARLSVRLRFFPFFFYARIGVRFPGDLSRVGAPPF